MLINLRNALMAGKRTPTAKDYVQSGLVAMWDGIENAGWGVHDPNAATWKDLINNIPITYSGEWEWNCYKLNNSYQYISCPTELSNLVVGGHLTMEFVCLSRWEDRYGGRVGFNNAGMSIAGYGSGDTQRQMLQFNGFGIVAWVISQQIYGDNPLTTILASACIDTSIGVSSSVKTITNGSEGQQVNAPRSCSPESTPPTWLNICSRKMYAMRFYNRALTNDEVNKNRQLDMERFNLS